MKKYYLKRQGNILFLGVLLLAFIMAGATAFFLYLKSLPTIEQLEQYEPTLTSQVVSNDGIVIKTFGAYKYEKVGIDEMPDYLKKAIIATEDQNFYHHQGFDLIALMRSSIKNIKARKVVQGASTITQQLARILFLSQEKTITRKIKELIIAYRLEKTISKNKILEMYLNNIYLGEGAYGVAAAANIYFGKRVQDLNLQECALIAGLPQAPSLYSPFRNSKLTKKRRAIVIERMLKEHYITQKQAERAINSKIGIGDRPNSETLRKAPYFIDFIMAELENKVGLTEPEIVQGGYKIYTTLNYQYQKAAEKALKEKMESWGIYKKTEEAALLSYDVVSGQILSYIGGKHYYTSQFDRVTQAIRQPGSSFKIFVYTTAMESGLTPFTVYNDAPVSIGDWHPRNYNGRYRGQLPLYKALTFSSNCVAAQIIRDVGVENVIRTSRKMGLTTPLAHDPTIALGSNGVKMIEMATAYGILANGGIKVEPYGIEKIETSNGKVIYVASNNYKRVLDVKTVAYMVEMMKQVVKHGTARASAIERPSAGKTGTTDSYKDAWYIGFTPDIVTAVWVGNDNNKSMANLTGGTVPAMIWHDYMEFVEKNKPVTDFMYPDVIMENNFEPDLSPEEMEKVINQEQTVNAGTGQPTKSTEKTSSTNQQADPKKIERIEINPSANNSNGYFSNNEKNNLGTEEDIPKPQKYTPVPVPIQRVKVKPTAQNYEGEQENPMGNTGF